MQTSGVTHDFYDDSRGDVFRALYPQPADVPAVVKTAHALSPEERQALPDDVFALVLMDEGKTLRKYACTDAGNTTLSIEYFLQTAGKLPAEAQKVAAANLVTACSWYDLAPPEALTKIALLGFLAKSVQANPIGALQTAITAPHVVQGVGQEIRARNDAVRGAGGVVTPAQVQEALGRTKQAELSGTPIMPNPPADVRPPVLKAVIAKTAMGVPHLVSGHGGEQGRAPAAAASSPSLAPPALPQMRVLRPHVDVTGKSPPTHVEEKKAALYALPGRYPLDGYDQIKAAGAYFVEYGSMLSPADRHEYCLNFVKRAAAVGLPIPEAARRYGSMEFADKGELKMAFDLRRGLVQDPQAREALTQLETLTFEAYDAWGSGEKQASAWADPHLCAGALAQFDEMTGLTFEYDRTVMDPYFALFGGQKTASEDYTFQHGNDSVTGERLWQLSVTGAKEVHARFTKDFAERFKKDPVAAFRSMPLEQKTVLMRMAATADSAIREE